MENYWQSPIPAGIFNMVFLITKARRQYKKKQLNFVGIKFQKKQTAFSQPALFLSLL